ncbi:2-hydroxy-6-oxo-6-phenylhexa-2,4-dienoate hydrolase [Sphingomonas paucimobilis]|nr:2-hydroxy-6-oxo-6-phenylhexa-2,4-dienoate hydrolase [Sphingomonas paucimobilis]
MVPRACFRRFLVLLAAAAVLAVIRVAAWVRERERDGRVPAHLRSVATPLGRVAADEHGLSTRRTVLIVPGTAGWSGFWRDVSPHLAARGYHVVAVDLPPFGYSEHDAAARYDRRSQAARLSAVLSATARGSAVVVAHSFGGGSATELALGHPDQVARLVLVDGALGELDPPRPGACPCSGQPSCHSR